MKAKRYFISGIGTGVGKTLVSAALVQRYGFDYWKPVQTGIIEDSDLDTVKNLVSKKGITFFPEAFRLRAPVSPHEAASLEQIELSLSRISAPVHKADLVIEGAGGLLAPLNSKELMVDLALSLEAELILVCSSYLGSINHTLLSLEYLRMRNIPCKGIIFNGTENTSSENLILTHSSPRLLARLPFLSEINSGELSVASSFLESADPAFGREETTAR